MNRFSKLAAVGLMLAGTFIAAPAATAAPTTLVLPSYTCAFNQTSYVTASAVKVHSNHYTTSPVVGQLNYQARFIFCGNAYPSGNGYNWAYGYGYNGSTKVTGWVVTKYIFFP